MADNEKLLSLDRMQSGQSGVIDSIQGGYGLVKRLSTLGIRHDKRITKISSMFMRGPVTIEIDRVQDAIGFGMASRIMVKIDE
jgi:ferrous iron transport protein A